MEKYKAVVISIIVGIFSVICVWIAVNGFTNYKQIASGGITATGSSSKDFVSDLVVWRGSFSATGQTTKDAYKKIKRDSEIVKKYLLDNGVKENEFTFSSVSIQQRYRREYNEYGNLTGEYPDGYDLFQELTVQSNDVDKIETISRDITSLIDSDVDFISNSPEYYYTKLDELKLEMIQSATENAKERVDIIAQNSNSTIGKLLNANLGVFQITAQNSASEEYSSGGLFNTSSKYKTASVTVKLYYAVD